VSETIASLASEMKGCSACRMRSGCLQVVPPVGQYDRPILLVFGEAPGEAENEQGEPFVGRAGQCIREAFRGTKVINRTNTLIANVMNCRPPGNKFPTDDCPKICVSKWLWKTIELATPQRILLLGGTPLKFVAGMDGITTKRGQWYDIKGIRTMATYHPSYILRCDQDDRMRFKRDEFEGDIREMAGEVAKLQEARP